jgi:inosose dehydratase
MAHQYLNDQAGIDALREGIERSGIRLGAAYCNAKYIEPDQAQADIEKVFGWGKALKSLGGDVVVIGPGGKRPGGYLPADYKFMAQTLNELGRRLSDIGVIAALHPHTGTSVETRPEIDQVMEHVDPRYVGFGPDIGQMQKAGDDPVDIVRTYRQLVRHIHIKDYIGGPMQRDEQGKYVDPTGYAGYVPLGQGVVDVKTILAMLDEDGYQGWLMVELDGTKRAPHAPKDAAALSKQHLDKVLAEINR